MNWDDIRHLLVVARAGSFVKAGRALKVEHTTVARRVARLEREVGARLLSRTREGVMLTSAGQAVAARLAHLEDELHGALRLAETFDEGVSGTVRIATAEIFANGFLCEQLPELLSRFPGLVVDLPVAQGFLDLAKREADVAVRLLPPGRDPADPELVARRVGEVSFALYGSRDYLARNPLPPGPVESLAGHRLLYFDQSAPRTIGAEWLKARDTDATYSLRSNTVTLLHAAATAGLGLTVLPTFLAERSPQLVRLTEGLGQSVVWVVVHPDAKRVRRIATVFHWLVEIVERKFRSPSA
ncbi:MAG TPA: LysR family transcriptional regulator [Myxococcaceae bacterium]|nr:LysR family transcriptional regulator [Myxococcaceae bacterium]